MGLLPSSAAPIRLAPLDAHPADLKAESLDNPGGGGRRTVGLLHSLEVLADLWDRSIKGSRCRGGKRIGLSAVGEPGADRSRIGGRGRYRRDLLVKAHVNLAESRQ